jgi:hypothetical protein
MAHHTGTRLISAALALTGIAAATTEAAANEACDQGCPYGVALLKSPPDSAVVPTNVRPVSRLLATAAAGLADPSGNGVALAREPFGVDEQWLIPDVALAPSTVYAGTVDGAVGYESFTTGMAPDLAAPADVQLTVTGSAPCGNVVVRLTLEIATSNESLVFVTVSHSASSGERVAMSTVGPPGTPLAACAWDVVGPTLDATVTVYDMAGNAAESQPISWTLPERPPADAGAEGGCSIAPRPGRGAPGTLGAMLLASLVGLRARKLLRTPGRR